MSHGFSAVKEQGLDGFAEQFAHGDAHTIFLGAFDPRVKVVVAQVPGLDVVMTLISIAGLEGFDGICR